MAVDKEANSLSRVYVVIEQCRHLANDCTTKYGCIDRMLFRYLSSCMGAIICDINAIGFVSVFAQRACGVRDTSGSMLCNRSSRDCR